MTTFNGTNGNDTFTGSAGSDEFNTLTGSDTVRGLGGNDRIVLTDDGSTDVVDGGSGWDWLHLKFNGAPVVLGGNLVNVDHILMSTTATSGQQSIMVTDGLFSPSQTSKLFLSVEGVAGVSYSLDARSLSGNHAIQTFDGLGNDTIRGGVSADTFVASRGNDSYEGGLGNDELLVEFGNSSLAALSLSGTATLGWTLKSGTSDVFKLEFINNKWRTTDLRTSVPSNSAPFGVDNLLDIEQIALNSSVTLPDGSGEYHFRVANLALSVLGGVPSVMLKDATLAGTLSNDVLIGTANNDQIFGFSGSDNINAGLGNDNIVLTDNGSSDTINGGAGFDSLNLRLSGSPYTMGSNISGVESVNFDLGNVSGVTQSVVLNNALFTGSTTMRIYVNGVAGGGTDNNFSVNGSAMTDSSQSLVFNNFRGNDSLVGTSGADLFNAGDGNDTVVGGAGNDDVELNFGNIVGDLEGFLTGNPTTGWTLAAKVSGGPLTSIMRFDYLPATAQWRMTDLRETILEGSHAFGTDLLSGVERIILSSKDPAYNSSYLQLAYLNLGVTNGFPSMVMIDAASVGTPGDDSLYGGSADDIIVALTGSDVVHAGAGNDKITITDDGGTDQINGGPGKDLLTLTVNGTNLNLMPNPLAPKFVGIEDFNLVAANGFTGLQNVTIPNDYKIGSYRLVVTAWSQNAAFNLDASSRDLGRSVYMAGGNLADTLKGGAGEDAFAAQSGDRIEGNTGFDTAYVNTNLTAVDSLSLVSITSTSWDVLSTASGTASAPGAVTTLLSLSHANGEWSLSGGSLSNAVKLLGVERVELQHSNGNRFGGLYLSMNGSTPALELGDLDLAGTAAAETLNGGMGWDTLSGGAGNDSLQGGLGSDTFLGSAGNDTLHGGTQQNLPWKGGIYTPWSDYDRADYSATVTGIALNLSNMTVSDALSANTAIGTDTLIGIERVDTTRANDVVTGTLSALGNSAATSAQNGLDVFMYGGNDTLTQDLQINKPWVNSVFVSYRNLNNWKINVTVEGASGTVTHSAINADTAPSLNGVDTINRISSFADTVNNDSFDFSRQTSNHRNDGSFSFVQLSAGNDTVVGNGATTVALPTNVVGDRGVNAQLSLAPVQVDLTHLSAGYGFSGVSGTTWMNLGVKTLSGLQSIRGTNLDDTLQGGAYDVEIFVGGAGNDFIDGKWGYDDVRYASGSSSLSGISVNLKDGIVVGDALIGTDTLRGVEAIGGTQFGDVFNAVGFSANSTNAGNKSDFNSFQGLGGNDTINGNRATRLSYDESMVAVSVDMSTGIGQALNAADREGDMAQVVGVDNFSGVYRLRGSALGDSLAGGGAGRNGGDFSFESYEPMAGNDTVNGKDGHDEVMYASSPNGIRVNLGLSSGQVIDDGYGGTDSLISIESVIGSAFDDELMGSDTNAGISGNQEIFSGNKGNDIINGLGGYDEVGYFDSPLGVNVNLTTGVALDGYGTTDSLTNIEGVEGSRFNDVIVGSSADNRIDGRLGDDTLDGAGGIDTAEFNNCTVSGVIVNLTTGTASGETGNDSLLNFENIAGSAFADELTGNAGSNLLEGSLGNDTMSGMAGNDTLDGGSGSDTVVFSGARANYTISPTAVGVYTVQDNRTNSPDGTDVLKSVEFMAFSDQTFKPGDPLNVLTGKVYDWKNHRLLNDVLVSVTPQGAIGTNAVAAQPFEFRNVALTPAGDLTADLWVNPGSAASTSIDLGVNFDSRVVANFEQNTSAATGLPAAWFLDFENSQPGNFRISAIGLEEVAKAVSLGKLTLDLPAGMFKTSLIVAESMINTTSFLPYEQSLGTFFDHTKGGTYNIEGLTDGRYGMTATKPAGTTETAFTAINSADALAALKIAVGRNPNADPDGAGPLLAPVLSPYQLIAADANQDGKVTSADALAILKMAVKRADAPAREIFFVNERQDFWDETANSGQGAFNMTRTQASWKGSGILFDSPETQILNLVAVLKGDVNGSWVANAEVNAPVLDNAYFTQLATSLNVPVTQWVL